VERGLKPESPIRRFYILRTHDASGIAGLGRIVEGVVMASGRVILEWRPPISSQVTFANWKEFKHVYLNPTHGCNLVILVDGEEPSE
jgi:hypothetical protein